MFKKLARSIRQYKKETILTPVCMFGEVVLECIIPLVMAKIVDAMDGGVLDNEHIVESHLDIAVGMESSV